MNNIAEIIERHKNIDVAILCQKCGALPLFVGKQYSVDCRCGNTIQITPKFLAQLKIREYVNQYFQEHGDYPKPQERKYDCRICRDTGLAIIEGQFDNTLSEYAFRCMCEHGQKRDDILGLPVLPLSWVIRYDRRMAKQSC